MLIDMRGLRPLKPQVVAMEVRNLVSSLIVDLTFAESPTAVRSGPSRPGGQPTSGSVRSRPTPISDGAFAPSQRISPIAMQPSIVDSTTIVPARGDGALARGIATTGTVANSSTTPRVISIGGGVGGVAGPTGRPSASQPSLKGLGSSDRSGMIRPMSPPPAPAANPAQFASAPATAAASQGAGSPTTEPASAPQAVGSGGGVQPAAGSGGGGSGSGGGGTPTTVSLHQSGDSLGYTDPNGNAYNQIGGQEGIAFSAGLAQIYNVFWTVQTSAYSGLGPAGPTHTGENAESVANWTTSGPYSGKFYWTEKPGTETIFADVTFIGGAQAQGKITITVQAPTLNTFTDTYQGVTKYNVKVAGGGQAANFVNAFDDGTTHKEGNVFNASISTSTLNSNLPASQYYYLQTVVPYEEDDDSDGHVVTYTPPSSTPMLDDGGGGQQVYMGITSPQIPAGQAGPIPLPSVSDSPRFKTTAADLTAFNNVQAYLNKVIISGSFVMYVVMQPPSGIPIAIGQLSWKYGFTATYGGGAYNDAASWDLTATSPAYPADGNNVYQGSAVNLVPNWVGWVSVDLVKTTK